MCQMKNSLSSMKIIPYNVIGMFSMCRLKFELIYCDVHKFHKRGADGNHIVGTNPLTWPTPLNGR